MTHPSGMIEMMLPAAPGQTVPRHGEDRRTGPIQPRNRLAFYEERLVCLWQRVVATLGIHTARVLLHRALWQTAQRHPDIALIRYDEAGLCFEAREMSYAARPQEEVEGYAIRPQDEIEAAFNDLCAELLLILTRLLGGEMAQRICAGPPATRQAGTRWA
jgi:hypothetical protein